MGKGLKGDFLGFTFNDIHSSTLGITRISGGDRYEEDLLPTFQDKVVDGPSTNETYYFDSYFKQRIINIQIAFDDLTETQIRKIRQLFGDQGIHELWFDETPYKAYYVKVSSPPKLRYLCFNRTNGDKIQRIYKGEGSISFIGYFPFGKSRFKYLEDYIPQFSNSLEWLQASGIQSKNGIDEFVQEANNNRKVNLWNGGDLETDFEINFYFGNSNYISKGSIYIKENEKLNLNKIIKKSTDSGIQINTKLKLIQGFKEENGKIKITKNIYNEYIASGDFFKIPRKSSVLKLQGLYPEKDVKAEIKYSYLYF